MNMFPAHTVKAIPGMVFMLAGFCGGAQAASDDDDPSVTPYRPTVSNPADLSAPGWLEAEFGGLRTFGEDHSRSDSVPWLLKYAFDENYGLLLGGNAYVSAQAPGVSRQSGVGDTSLEWKQRFPVNDKTAFGIEAGVVAPTAAHALGVGKPEWLVNGIFSADVGALHLDLNLGGAHASAHDATSSPWQTTWAAAISRPLTADWGAAFELSGTHQRGSATTSQALAAVNYNLSHRVVLDTGVTYGLTRAAHDRSVFAGATVLLGRLRSSAQ
jgi:hypothetical protein